MGLLTRFVVILCLCVMPMSVTVGLRADAEWEGMIPFGAKIKTPNQVQRHMDQLAVAESQFQPSFVYQQPVVLVHPAYNIQPASPTAGYIYKKPTSGGYVYKPPTTTTTTTTTTTPEPAIEQEQDIDSQFLTPAPPPPVFPEREFEESPVEDETPDKWDIRDSIPGTPGDDYPVLGSIPKTSFRCEGRIPGYYADPETKCQVFHRCSDCTDNVRLQMDSFLCPNGTQFNQEILSCDWWGNVHCENALQYYAINEELNVVGEDGKYLQLSAMRHAPQLLDKKIAPAIIPKEERRPLPAKYRSRHSHNADHGNNDDKPIRSSTTQTPIIFNEFSKPVTSTRTEASSSSNNAIEAAFNNPDYFNPSTDAANDDNESRNSEMNDEDYSNEGDPSVQLRSSVEDFGDKVDNEPLFPQKSKSPVPKSAKAPAPLKTSKPLTLTTQAPVSTLSRRLSPTTTYKTEKPTTTTRATTLPPTTTTTTLPTTLKTVPPTTSTTPAPETEVEENDVQPLISFQRQTRDDDEASGFIVNNDLPNRKKEKDEENLEDAQLLDRPPAPPTDFESSTENGEQDSYLPQKTEPEVPPTYIPPSAKPKLTYKPVTQPKQLYGPPPPSNYLSPKATYESPVPLPTYPGNPYIAAPIPQQPPTFNLVQLPRAFANQYTPTHHAQPQQFNVVQAHVPVLNFGQFPSAQSPLTSYINPGGFSFSNIPSASNYFANTYFG